jgi:hypothetical protein
MLAGSTSGWGMWNGPAAWSSAAGMNETTRVRLVRSHADDCLYLVKRLERTA